MHFTKQDLSGTKYNWAPAMDSGLYTGEPTRRMFDRFNGYQVLFLINYFAARAARFSLEEGRRLESRIREKLPFDIKSELSVFHWIRNDQ